MIERMTAEQYQAETASPKKTNKYSAQRTSLDGVTFDSKAEAMRFAELDLEQKAGEISDLTLQPRYPLVVNGTHVCTYVGDFTYRRAGKVIVEDVKGVRSPVYRLKAKLVKAVYGFEIVEVRA